MISRCNTESPLLTSARQSAGQHEHRNEAQAIYKKAEKMGVKIQDQAQLTPFVDSTKDPLVAQPPPPTSQTKHNQGNIIASIPPLVFSENVRPTTAAEKLPEPDERLANTPQLACCLALLKDFHSLDDILEPAARNWLQVVENDEDEQERLKVLATDVVRTFKKEEIKDAKAVSEVVCLVPVLRRIPIEICSWISTTGSTTRDFWTFINSKDSLR
ncbi:hypothetical protein B0O80DRAFT_282471 [Mortierella sp. GBAus27b]|nr:hypothetical protein B0O80DRAFT_282471 [Mortierella sp. GBAus27b]